MAAIDKLQQIKNRIPVLNEQAQRQIDAGRAFQLQQAAKAAPQTPNVTTTAQALAPAVQQQAGQAMVQQQAAEQQQLGQMAQGALRQSGMEQEAALQRQARQQQEALAGKEREQQLALSREQQTLQNQLTQEEIDSNKRVQALGMDVDNQLSFLSRKQREDLSSLGQDVKAKLFDSRLQFERDEMGRKFSNDRQLMDYAISSAVSQQDVQNKMREMEQAANKELIMLEVSYKKISDAVERGYLDEKRELDQEQQKNLVLMKNKIEKQMRDKQRQAANRRMIVGAVISAVGVGMLATGVGAAAAPAVIGAGTAYGTGGQR